MDIKFDKTKVKSHFGIKVDDRYQNIRDALPRVIDNGRVVSQNDSCVLCIRVVSICKCTPENACKSANVQDWVFIMTLMTVSSALLHCTTWFWCVVFRFLSLLHAPTNLVGAEVHILIGAMSFVVQYCP